VFAYTHHSSPGAGNNNSIINLLIFLVYLLEKIICLARRSAASFPYITSTRKSENSSDVPGPWEVMIFPSRTTFSSEIRTPELKSESLRCEEGEVKAGDQPRNCAAG
jgi:hypothetical protein